MARPGKGLLRFDPRFFAAPHGGVACDALNELKAFAESDDSSALSIIASYAESGAIDHMRAYAASILAGVASRSNSELIPLFLRLIDESVTRYWATKAIARSQGSAAYPKLVELAMDTRLPPAERSNAVKEISLASRQLFDRQLPSDPGHWRERDLRLDEVRAWAANGFPIGPGHPVPRQDPAIDRPVTRLEQAVSRLQSRLAANRRNEDPANPSNRFVSAAAEDLGAIKSRWKLPEVYLEFLTRFSPLRVTVTDDERFYNGGLALYGAAELIQRQVGYAVDEGGNLLKGWPAHYLIIADHGADPYVLDLSGAPQTDAPVRFAEHGMGEWDFAEEAFGFVQFLERLTISS